MLAPAAAPFVIHMAGPGQPAPADVFGVWRSPPGEPELAEPPPLVVWRADLPRQANRALQTLAESERLLRRAELALPYAEQRLHAFTGQAAGGAEAEDQLRQDLRQHAQLQQALLAGGRAYALDWAVPAGFTAAAEDAARFFRLLQLAAARTTRVETAAGGRVIAQTDCAWSGSFQTRLSPRLRPNQVAEHTRLVDQTLVSRRALIRMGMLISAGAASLMAGAFSGPLVLLSVFQFVKAIVAEVQQLR